MPGMCPCLCLLSVWGDRAVTQAAGRHLQVPQIFLGGAAAFAATSLMFVLGAGTGHSVHSCRSWGVMELLKDSGL